jgi:spore maturation protein CgeB
VNVAFFYHSAVSDWNHGNAHFLRGVARELVRHGHEVRVFEPRDGWSRRNLLEQHGLSAAHEFRRAFPELRPIFYDPESFDVEAAIDGAELVLVHEWNEPALVRRIGLCREHMRSFVLLFHDTHHRSVTAPREMRRYDLRHYDGVLAYGDVIRDLYLDRGWTQRAWTWHEAADVRLFRPLLGRERAGDVVWIGNWGDGERTEELQEFLLAPARDLELTGSIFGVRYPESARRAISLAGLPYRGWVANHRVPEIFARHALTVHIPRRPYADALPGIPTIRPFEALACGIPLICSPWDDVEGLFTADRDYLVARNGDQMRKLMSEVLEDASRARELAQHGRRTILERHTCAHRVDELLAIARDLGARVEPERAAAAESVS